MKTKIPKSRAMLGPKWGARLIKQTSFNSLEFRHLLSSVYPLVFLGLSFSIYQGLKSRWILQNGDAAGYVDTFSSSGFGEFSSFTYGSSLFQLLKLVSIGPTTFDNQDFLNVDKDFNIFNSHAYLLPYAFMGISNLFSSIEFIPLLLISVSYASGIVLLLKLGKATGLGVTLSLCSLAIVIMSPIFYDGLGGQPYMDRIFFGPCIAIMYLIYCDKYQTVKGFVLTALLIFLVVMISERASLMIGIVVMFQLAFKLKPKRDRNAKTFTLLLIGLAAILWYFIWNLNFNFTSYSAVVTPREMYRNLTELFFGYRQSNFQTLITCLLPFGLIGLFNRKFLLLSVILLLPNLVLTIGGAELIGFSTHYHALYFPTISFMLFAKVSQANNFLENRIRSLIYTLSVSLAIFANLTFLTPPNQTLMKSSNLSIMVQKIGNALGALPKNVNESRQYLRKERVELTNIHSFNQAKRVSSPEALMPALTYQGIRDIDYFPIGLGENDLIFVPFTDGTFDKVQFDLFGQVPTMDRDMWSKIILGVIEEKYIQIKKYNGSLGSVAVYQRKKD
jgi:hypothetical protein